MKKRTLFALLGLVILSHKFYQDNKVNENKIFQLKESKAMWKDKCLELSRENYPLMKSSIKTALELQSTTYKLNALQCEKNKLAEEYNQLYEDYYLDLAEKHNRLNNVGLDLFPKLSELESERNYYLNLSSRLIDELNDCMYSKNNFENKNCIDD